MKKCIAFYMYFALLSSSFLFSMDDSYEEIIYFVQPWAVKVDQVHSYLKESKELQKPVGIMRDQVLQAIFDSVENRVTLYTEKNCCCIYLETFFGYLDLLVQSKQKPVKKCIVQ